MKGCVYIASMEGVEGRLKIGMTHGDPYARVVDWGKDTGAPGEPILEYAAYLNTDPQPVETDVHRALKSYRERGEWFKVDLAVAVREVRDTAGSAIIEEFDRKNAIAEAERIRREEQALEEARHRREEQRRREEEEKEARQRSVATERYNAALKLHQSQVAEETVVARKRGRFLVIIFVMAMAFASVDLFASNSSPGISVLLSIILFLVWGVFGVWHSSKRSGTAEPKFDDFLAVVKEEEEASQITEEERLVAVKEEERAKWHAYEALDALIPNMLKKISNAWELPPAEYRVKGRTSSVVSITVEVTPTGEVTSAQVDGGDLADFLKNALLRASPLPFPQDPDYYEYIKAFTLRFRLETRGKSFSLTALLNSGLVRMVGDTKYVRPYTEIIR